MPTSFVQLLLILAAVWLRPRRETVEGQAPGAISRSGWSWLLTLYFTLVWVIQIAGAWRLYWLVIAAAALPWVIVMVHRGVHYVLREPDPETGAKPVAPVVVAMIDRAIRMALIVAGAFFLARVWGLDLVDDDVGRHARQPHRCAARSTPPSSSSPPISAGASSRR